MISNDRHSLPGVIAGDLLRHGKIPLILAVAVLVSSILVVTTAHKTRLLTAQREQLVLERDALDIEWRNLILEENALGDHSRVEKMATEKLQMQHVDPSQENIVVQPLGTE
ncbi:cell division protein FtsL [Erwinia endophytica]|uniref:cell division protein FtsL n=1 Tax=Erwinia endophytica TaxID=1563158 RepID=UPI001265F3EC|nr:cell division protein FtsL [Erwinia endophytica]KAB8306180.1 cell division protein FtsL [Erwinia endophytica]